MICVCVFEILSAISFANELYANVSERTLQGASESYAGSRFYWKPSYSRLFFERLSERASYTGGFGRIEDSRVEEACLVLGVGSDGERIGGPDHTMGGQGEKRTDDGDVDADTREASAGTRNRYGKGPGKRKGIGH